MKDVESRLLAELFRNSRRSDRELAKVLHVSQPTVSRAIKRLEEQGVIKDYTMIPNFEKLGYQILALTFLKVTNALNKEQINRVKDIIAKSLKTGPFEVVMLERGLGLEFDAAMISYHTDYSSHVKLLEWLKQFDFLSLEETGSFLINLQDQVRYHPLSLSTLANHLLQMSDDKKSLANPI